MAFRKRRFFRRRINGKLSRKHYTWVTALNNLCSITPLSNCTPGVEEIFCCPSNAQLVLLDNAVIQSSFQDAIRVVRIHGSLTFAWNLAQILSDIDILIGDCADAHQAKEAYIATFAGSARSGIAVREIHNGDLTTLPRMNPLEDYDFSEGRWKQMRFHQSVADLELGVTTYCNVTQTGQQGICSDVTGTSPGATATICTPVALAPQPITGQMNVSHVRMPQHWTWNFNNKLNMRVRENQLPVMSVGWQNVDFFNGALPSAGLSMMGGVKLLIEVG